jgi:hypothetical protein
MRTSKYVREVRTGRSIDRGLHPHLAYVLGGVHGHSRGSRVNRAGPISSIHTVKQ